MMMNRRNLPQPRISEEEDFTDDDDDVSSNDVSVSTTSESLKDNESPETMATSQSSPLPNGRTASIVTTMSSAASVSDMEDDLEDEEDDEFDEGDDEFDEENDDFSVTLNEGDEDFEDTSHPSNDASSVATDDQSLGSYGSFGASSSAGTTTEVDVEGQKVARKEAKAVRWGRFIALSFLILVGALFPYGLHRIAAIHDEEQFDEEYDYFADQLGEAWQTQAREALIALDSIAVDMTLEASMSNYSWPLVTFPSFPVSSANARLMSPVISTLLVAPLVTDDDRQDYEEYTVENQDWMDASEQWHELTARQDSRALKQVYDEIYETLDQPLVAPTPGPYYPIRQSDPLNRTLVNLNLLSVSMVSTELEISNTNCAVVGRLLIPDELVDRLALQMPEEEGDIFGTLVFPIPQQSLLEGDDIGPGGAIVALVSWTGVLSSVLPSKIRDVTAVVENTCGQVVSFKVSGSIVTPLALEDVHDNDWSSHRRTFELSMDLAEATTTRVALADSSLGACDYTLTVYPSDNTMEAFESRTPGASLGIGFAAFFLVMIIVIVYDVVLERRNKALLSSATEARAIVSSLFPANVRDRLFETNREKKKKKKKSRKKRLRKKLRLRKKKKGGNEEDGGGSERKDEDDSPLNMGIEKAPDTLLTPESVQSLWDSATGNAPMSHGVSHPKHRLKTFLANAPNSRQEDKSEDFSLNKPIADLFPHCTVFFADIVGFTAWSSEREPADVFTLLQTIYQAFDRIAKRRGVFKVETIGDCYVAVTGLPDPQPDHAVRMTKFARECIQKMNDVTKKLEVSLGPDTGDLLLRLGLNSGPVTAGVLQGEKSRFQLFGDTVNTASRMESTGEPNKIHLSKSTADFLTQAGKAYWVKPRDDLVHAKGKGNIQTYWLVFRGENPLQPNRSSETLGQDLKRRAPGRSLSGTHKTGPTRGVKRTTSDSVQKMDKMSDLMRQGRESNDMREERLIQWQVEMFVRLLKRIVASRAESVNSPPSKPEESKQPWRHDSPLGRSIPELTMDDTGSEELLADSNRFDHAGTGSSMGIRMPKRELSMHPPARRPSMPREMSTNTFQSFGGDDSQAFVDSIALDEVVEVITMPKFSSTSIQAMENATSVELDEVVVNQLKDYITTIAHMYRENPFHNFEHASHVTMSANKLLNRIVIPENVDYQRESNAIAIDLHDYTYGITSDPLTQFAVVFSALVHDVDHSGVPNGQLAKENPDMAIVYRNQCIAEQNSIDLAWELFMDNRYKELQNCITATVAEKKRFRQLVVNSVMATDIFAKDMKALREKRWEKAFHGHTEGMTITDESIEADRSMKATIVIEHIIQASDVAHTMQHWHIYQKWNERLFNEMYSAFECGRSDKNPADSWYKGELWFFDNYVIPLAKKLEECNVFGVASDECLNYAQANRSEWSVKGEESVQDMVDRYHKRKFFVAGMAKKRVDFHERILPSAEMDSGNVVRLWSQDRKVSVPELLAHRQRFGNPVPFRFGKQKSPLHGVPLEVLASRGAWNRKRLQNMILAVGEGTPAHVTVRRYFTGMAAKMREDEESDGDDDDDDNDNESTDDGNSDASESESVHNPANSPGRRPMVASDGEESEDDDDSEDSALYPMLYHETEDYLDDDMTQEDPSQRRRCYLPRMTHRGCINTAAWLNCGWRIAFNETSCDFPISKDCTTQLVTSGDDHMIKFWDVGRSMGTNSPLPGGTDTQCPFADVPELALEEAHEQWEQHYLRGRTPFSVRNTAGSVLPLVSMATGHRGNVFHVTPLFGQPGKVVTCGADGYVRLSDLEREISSAVVSPEYEDDRAEALFSFPFASPRMCFSHHFLSRNTGLVCSERGLRQFDLRLSPREQSHRNLLRGASMCKACAVWSTPKTTHSLEAGDSTYVFAAGGSSAEVCLYDLRMSDGASSRVIQEYCPRALKTPSIDVSVSGLDISKDKQELLVSYESDHIYTFPIFPKVTNISGPTVEELDAMTTQDSSQPLPELACYGAHLNRFTFLKNAKYAGPLDEYICTGSDSGRAWIYEKETGRVVSLLNADRSTCNGVIPHPTLPIFISYGIDSNAKLWRAIPPVDTEADDSPEGRQLRFRQRRYKPSPVVHDWEGVARNVERIDVFNEFLYPDDVPEAVSIRRSLFSKPLAELQNGLRDLPDIVKENFWVCICAYHTNEDVPYAGSVAGFRNRVRLIRTSYQADCLGLVWDFRKPWRFGRGNEPNASLLKAELLPECPSDTEEASLWRAEFFEFFNIKVNEYRDFYLERYSSASSSVETKKATHSNENMRDSDEDWECSEDENRGDFKRVSVGQVNINGNWRVKGIPQAYLEMIDNLRAAGNEALDIGAYELAASRYDKALRYAAFVLIDYGQNYDSEQVFKKWSPVLKAVILTYLNLSLLYQKIPGSDFSQAIFHGGKALTKLQPFCHSIGKAKWPDDDTETLEPEYVFSEAILLKAKAHFRMGSAKLLQGNYGQAALHFNESILASKAAKVKPDKLVVRRLAEAKQQEQKLKRRRNEKMKRAFDAISPDT
eukprot:Nitzschia sp. Nitz4//scaffold197_size40390//30718//39231//NITZ4_007521-RA/size40390-augustus-gene-0.11-mRNA-1//1//CDS//3329540496//4628//frame0